MIRKMAIVFALCVIALCSVFGCAQQHQALQKEYGPDRIHSLNEFKRFKEPSDFMNRVLCLQPGDPIPVKLSMESDWFGLQQNGVDLVAKRKIYVRVGLPENISRERLEKLTSLDEQKLAVMSEVEKAALFDGVMLYLSRDAVHWAPLNDKTALKETFDIKEGTLSAGMGMNMAEGLWIALRVETFRK